MFESHLPTHDCLPIPHNVRKHFPKKNIMVRDHMSKQRRNIMSKQPPPKADDQNMDVEQEGKWHAVYVTVVQAGQIYTYLTHIIPQQSNSCNKYILVLYEYDDNIILTRAMKNINNNKKVVVFDAHICISTDWGLKPQLQLLDHEASRALKRFLTSQYIDFYLDTPHMHHRNATECVIYNFKTHGIAGICSVYPLLPMKLWGEF
jgi:hypothetical protein